MSFLRPKRRVSIKDTFAGEEISLISIFWLIYERKLFILGGMAVFLVAGIITARTTPTEYEAKVEILSEGSEDGSFGGLSDLIGLAGVRGNSRRGSASAGGVDADMFPQIISSTPFLLSLLDEQFQFKKPKKKLSVYEYFATPRPKPFFPRAWDYVKDLPANIKILFGLAKEKPLKIPKRKKTEIKGYPTILRLNGFEKRAIGELKKRINISSSGRIITLTVKVPEPEVAAQFNTVVLARLIEYLSAYKTEKLVSDLQFIRQSQAEAEAKYLQAQRELAFFRDTHQGRLTKIEETREQQLQFNYQLVNGLYVTLTNQLQQAEIQVKKETPFFSDFEPVTIPGSPSEPKPSKIVTLYTGLGAAVGLLFILGSIVIGYFKESRASVETGHDTTNAYTSLE
ncbi:hypothetical protein RT717_24825 [Imperialibacter roseus]|uniref:Polysaccharide chain length determinant N-terminal domain-containing protein n=1 Tax=Imperialibacter roseus TaxID=1324217 RepID=A0ABZ0IMN8_9BACT|nr:hypothetical protein [Imperialibacter roseus]WOK06302.1 hypothetical protein RT717_24825 [Imperialibacter roseus]